MLLSIKYNCINNDTDIETGGAAARGIANSDIVEAAQASGVYQRVQETERWQSLGKACVVQEAHKPCKCRRRCRGPSDKYWPTLKEDTEII